MLKCLFVGHKWQLETTHKGTRTCSLWLGKYQTQHDLTIEYYKCSRCGLWKSKTFVDHTLEKTNLFVEKPIEETQC